MTKVKRAIQFIRELNNQPWSKSFGFDIDVDTNNVYINISCDGILIQRVEIDSKACKEFNVETFIYTAFKVTLSNNAIKYGKMVKPFYPRDKSLLGFYIGKIQFVFQWTQSPHGFWMGTNPKSTWPSKPHISNGHGLFMRPTTPIFIQSPEKLIELIRLLLVQPLIKSFYNSKNPTPLNWTQVAEKMDVMLTKIAANL